MSNYHVEPIDKPKALTPQAIKALRKEQVQGLSRRQLMRMALGAGVGLFTLEALAGTVAFAWPNLSKGFGGVLKIGTLDDVKAANTNLPINEGFPAYFAEARAFGSPEARALLAVGFLGGFTTFSAFANETVLAARDGVPWVAGANVLVSVALCLAAVWAGRALVS